MKKWGLLVTTYYAATVVAMLWPFFLSVLILHFGDTPLTWHSYTQNVSEIYREAWFAVPVAVVFLGQILLFVTIDRSARRLKPRASIFWPAALFGLFTAVLGFCVVTSIGVAVKGDKFLDYFDPHVIARVLYLAIWPVLWIGWAIVFYVRIRAAENPLARAVSWLLRGSILEFLIVVPCHVVVRRRDDCCAPLATSLGLCTGLAVMLIAFGPSVLLLYKKQMDSYKPRV
jgi:hypothetical protein